MVPRLLLAFALASVVVFAQGRTPPPRSPEGLQMEKSPDATPPLNSAAKLLKYQHEEVKKDMEKLVRLTTEVQEELEKAGENVLPLNSLKKLEEVEKLSRKVRSRLKQ